ncbi:MAG: tetratricopeptide repeat protein, partial [Deltaproteobacteria bacterium]|nr:tetratricopeptide repeat protein [Deltaproteobacteria bacterium]
QCVPDGAVWSAEQQQVAEAGVRRVGGAMAGDTWTLLAPRLGGHAHELSVLRQGACEKHRRGLVPEEHYARQVACLDRSEAALSELVGLLGRADATAVTNANRAALQLPSPSSCTDIDRLLTDEPAVEDPALATRVAELRRQLARASTEESAGLYDEAAARADLVVKEATQLSYRPLRAEALVRRGSAWMQLGRPEASTDLDDALWAALASEQRRVAAEAAAKRVFVRADAQGEDRDATEAIAMARSLVERVGAADWRTRWVLSNNVGIVLDLRGDGREALAAFERALSEIPPQDDRGRFERATTLTNMVFVQQRLGQLELAARSGRRAIEETEAVLGPTHPRALETRVELARAHRFAGRYADARASLDDLFARAPDAAPPIAAVFEAAVVARHQGQRESARQWIERGQAIREPPPPAMWLEAFAMEEAMVAAAGGDDSPLDRLAVRGIDIGADRRAEVLLALGRPADAEALLTPRVDVDDPTRYPDYTTSLLGRALVAQQRWSEAERRLAPLFESEGLGERLGALEQARALLAMAAAQWGLGDTDDASARVGEAAEVLATFDRQSVPVRELETVRAMIAGTAENTPPTP